MKTRSRAAPAGILLRRTNKSDWLLLTEWFSLEGWNYADTDIDVDLEVNPEGFIVAEDEAGQLLGHIAATRHGDKYGYISLFIVDPNSRHKGIGSILWDAAREYLGSRIVMLDTATSGEFTSKILTKYPDFKPFWEVQEYGGVPRLEGFQAPRGPYHLCHAQMIRPEDLALFDKKIVGLNRVAWLRKFINHSNDWIPGSVAVFINKDSDIYGFGVIRPGKAGAKIGPVYALNLDVARLLLRSLVDSFPPAKLGVHVAVVDDNQEAKKMLLDLSLKPTSRCQRLCSGELPPINYSNVYSTSNCELEFI